MRSGLLRHEVTIQANVETQAADGSVARTWSDIATVAASIEPLSGREGLLAAQINPEVTHLVKMRYRDDVNSRCRLLFGARVFQVDSVLNTQERNIELVLQCIEDQT